MAGDRITINLNCKPWIAENASARDLLRMTDRIEKLAPALDSESTSLCRVIVSRQ
jgi:hypothetical protein